MPSCHNPPAPAKSFSYDGGDLEILQHMPRYHNWIMGFIRPYLRGRAVEYGCGTGTFSTHIEPLVDSLDLVEPASNLCDILRQRFSVPRLTLSNKTLEDDIAGRAAASVDTAVLINVLEHIENDCAALAELHRIMARDGHLLIFVPALNWLMSDLDRIHGHHRRYYRDELIDKVSKAGFTVTQARYGDFIGIFPWLILNKLLRQTDFNLPMIKFYDRYIHRLTVLMEKWVSPPIGKNILLVARRTRE